VDGHIAGQGVFHFQFQSWESFLSLLFVPDPTYNQAPFHSQPGLVPWIKYGILLTILVAAIAALRKVKSLPEGWRFKVYTGLLGITGFALLPASATYHFAMLTLPVLVLVTIHDIDNRIRWTLVILYAGIGFIPYSFFAALAAKWGVFFGFPRLWAITLLFVVTLFAVRDLERKFVTP
jgi:hypothetical protein